MKQLIMFILIIVTVAAVYYGIKTHLYDEGETVNDEFEVKGDIKTLDIKAAMLNVKIEDGDEIKITYKGDERLKPDYTYDETTKTLKIEQKKTVKTTNLSSDNKLTIEIPENHQMDNFTLELDMGNLKVDEIIAKEISIEDNMGNVEIEKTDSDSIVVDANMGNVTISKCDAKDVEVKAAMGNVEIKLEEDIKDYSIDASASLGNLTIGNDKVSGSYKQSGEKGTIKVECSLGDVDIR